MEQEGFSSQTAARLAGITYRQLDHWARSGLLPPSLSPAEPGIGHRRRYSYIDVVALCTVAELRRAGVSLQALRRAWSLSSVVLGLAWPLQRRGWWWMATMSCWPTAIRLSPSCAVPVRESSESS